MNVNRLLECQIKQSKILKEHGFNQWPDLIALAQYAMELSDRIDAIAKYLDIDIEKDYRDRWVVHSDKNGATNG